jgi:hypothetical protein
MAFIVKDFADIIDAVREDLKVQESDTTTLERIERCVNMAYMDVVDFKRWPWMSGHTKVVHKAVYQDDDCSVTPDSATVTLNTAPAVGLGSFAGYKFSTSSNPEIYTILTHTAGSTSITLSSNYQGELEDEQAYKIWREEVDLPADCKEVVEVWHNHNNHATMEGLGRQEFRRRQNEAPKYEGRPFYFSQTDYYDPTSGTAETESDRYRRLLIHPSIYTENTTIHIDYNKEITELDADGDEPAMPKEQRNVLVMGALMYAWASIMRNEETAAKWERKFYDKLSRMAGKVEDGFDKPQLVPDGKYMLQKRGRRAGRGVRGSGFGSSGGGSTYTSPTYLSNVTINTARITGNITVDAGITIDGVDISALSAEVDTLQALSSGQIFVGNSSNVTTAVTPTGDVTISNTGVTAIAAGVIEDTDINASAAIALTKLATVTASRALVSTAGGVISPATTTATEIGYVNGVTSAIQTQLDSKVAKVVSTDNAITRFDGIAGAVQNSGVTISDANAVAGAASYATTGGAYMEALVFGNTGGGAQRLTFNNGPTGVSMDFTDAAGYNGWDAFAQFRTSHASVPTLRIKGIASQTANLIETKNNGGTTLNYTSADGVFQADAGFGGKRTATATDYSVLKTDVFVAVTSTASARVMTLPAANTFKAGQVVIIKDESGGAATNNVSVARAGSDTIDGATSVSITANYGVVRLYSNGSDKWFSF